MRAGQNLKFNSVRLGSYMLAFGCSWASIAWSQHSGEHLIAPITVASSAYFNIENQRKIDESLASDPSTRRRKIPHLSPIADCAASFSGDTFQANLIPVSDKSSRVTPSGFASQDEENRNSVDLEEKKQDEESASDWGEPEAEVGQYSTDQESSSNANNAEKIGRGSFWVRKKIQDVRTNIQEAEPNAPEDRSSELDYGLTDWSMFSCAPKTFAWVAPDIRYQPLYFEDVALERYGQTLGFHRQTIRSGFHFFKSGITYPNKLRHDRHTCESPLGFCRPGTCVPAIKQKHYLGRPN